MSDNKDRKKKIRRWIFFALVVLMVGGIIFGRSGGDDAPARESIELNAVPLGEIEQTDEEIAEVAMIVSDKENAADITDEEVRDMVREAVALAGGLEDIVSDGDFVVLKPNMIAAKHVAGGLMAMMDGDEYVEEKLLDPRANGIATDFRVAQAVAEMVRELNPSGQIYIMETSGWGNTPRNMEILGYTYENFPMVDVITNFDDIGSDPAKYEEELVAIDLGDVKLFEAGDALAHTNDLYFMEQVYYSADVIIDLPVLKNHSNAGFTGAVKNVAIGVAPVNIYGNNGMLALNRMAIPHSWDPLNRWIHDFYLVKPVDFVVTDGLQGTGFGPVAMGAPSLEEAQQNMRLILAGKDPLAVDTIHAYLVGTDPQQVDYMVYLGAEGIGITDPAKINVLGNESVGNLKKLFGLPGFPMTLMSPEPRQVQYDDFDAPQISAEDVQVTGDVLAGSVSADEALIKVDVYLDGEFAGMAEIVEADGTTLTVEYSNEDLASASNIMIRVFDEYLNSADINL